MCSAAYALQDYVPHSTELYISPMDSRGSKNMPREAKKNICKRLARYSTQARVGEKGKIHTPGWCFSHPRSVRGIRKSVYYTYAL